MTHKTACPSCQTAPDAAVAVRGQIIHCAACGERYTARPPGRGGAGGRPTRHASLWVGVGVFALALAVVCGGGAVALVLAVRFGMPEFAGWLTTAPPTRPDLSKAPPGWPAGSPWPPTMPTLPAPPRPAETVRLSNPRYAETFVPGEVQFCVDFEFLSGRAEPFNKYLLMFESSGRTERCELTSGWEVRGTYRVERFDGRRERLPSGTQVWVARGSFGPNADPYPDRISNVVTVP